MTEQISKRFNRLRLFGVFQLMAFGSLWKPAHGLQMIGHACIGAEKEREDEIMAAARGLSTTQKPPQLWCMHVLGPDDLYPAPSKMHAELAAQVHNERFKEIAGAAGVMCEAVAAPWPLSAEAHAEGVGQFIADHLIHGVLDRALSAVGTLACASQQLLNTMEPAPKADCSCCVSPPCGDCVSWAGQREAEADVRQAIASAKAAFPGVVND